MGLFVKKRKILILGATGFVGRNLYEHLNPHHDVDAPRRTELNVMEENDVKRWINKRNYDIIINALDLRQASSEYFEERLRMFMNLAKCNDLYGRMIYFGSGAEYARELPIINIKEDEIGRKIPEDTYGFCLQQMNECARSSQNIYNLRIFGIFGPYELWQKRFISNSICKALFDYPITIRQNVVFDYLDVADLCCMVDWLMEAEPNYHDYNAVSGKRYELLEIAKLIGTVMEKQVPILIAKDGYGSEYTASNERILEEMTGFQPKEIKTSIRHLLDWYRKHLAEIERSQLLY